MIDPTIPGTTPGMPLRSCRILQIARCKFYKVRRAGSKCISGTPSQAPIDHILQNGFQNGSNMEPNESVACTIFYFSNYSGFVSLLFSALPENSKLIHQSHHLYQCLALSMCRVPCSLAVPIDLPQ